KGGRSARITVGFVGVDSKRTKTLETSRAVLIRRAMDGSALDDVNLFSRVTLPAREQTITAVLSDETAGVLGVAQSTLPARDATQPGVLGLALYGPSRRSVWVEVPSSSDGAEPGSRREMDRVGPTLMHSFRPGEPVEAGFRLEP